VAFGNAFEELPASPGKALELAGKTSSGDGAEDPVPGLLSDAVFNGPADREGKQIIHWLSRMFSRPAITNDVVRRMQRLRHLPGHQKLTFQRLEQFEAEVYGTSALESSLPEWMFKLVDSPVNGFSFEPTEAKEQQKKDLDVFLKAWTNHVALNLAALRMGNYLDIAQDLDALDKHAETWRQRIQQLEVAPWKFFDWLFPGGRACIVPIQFCGGGFEAVAPGLFLAFDRLRCAPEANRLVLAPLVRKFLSESPAFFVKTDPICGWSTRLGMSSEEVARLTIRGEEEIRKAIAVVQRASDLGLEINTHVGKARQLSPEDFVDDPPASVRAIPACQSESSPLSEDEGLRIAVECGVLSQRDVECLAAKRAACLASSR
jgi:hypothetical protein